MLVNSVSYSYNQNFGTKKSKFIIINGAKYIPLAEYKKPITELTDDALREEQILEQKIADLVVSQSRMISYRVNKGQPINFDTNSSIVSLEHQIQTFENRKNEIRQNPQNYQQVIGEPSRKRIVTAFI